MKYRYLGKTGLKVSEVGFGSWQIGGSFIIGGYPTGYGWVTKEESIESINTAIEYGVNFFDTADIYGIGRSEWLIGEALKGKRNKFIIATKCGALPDGEKSYIGDFSYEHIISACNRSLRRLQTDYIDLLQLHCFACEGEILEEIGAFEALAKLQKDGKIRFCGVSIDDSEQGLKIMRHRNELPVRIDAFQVIYNLITLEPRKKLFPLCKELGIGVIVRVPFAYGILTGKISQDTKFADDDWRKEWLTDSEERKWFLEKLSFVDKICKELDLKKEELWKFALHFILYEDAVSTVIPGIKNKMQAIKNFSVVQTEISKDIIMRFHIF